MTVIMTQDDHMTSLGFIKHQLFS